MDFILLIAMSCPATGRVLWTVLQCLCWLTNYQRINSKILLRFPYMHEDGENSFYYKGSSMKWYIGKSGVGASSRGVEAHSIALCGENTGDGDWFEYRNDNWLESKAQVRCLDNVKCCSALQVARNNNFDTFKDTGRKSFERSIYVNLNNHAEFLYFNGENWILNNEG